MHCAHCGAETIRGPCSACGRPPQLLGRYRLLRERERTDHTVTWAAEAVIGTPVDVVIGGDRVAREAAILGELTLPCAPRVVEHRRVELGGRRREVLVRQHVDGDSLADALVGPRLSTEAVLDLAQHLAMVLEDLHGLAPPVVHGDLAPAHVLRTPSGGLVLIAFGAISDGTFGTMAPEQYRGDVSPRSDQYGLGATVVHVLTRRPPHTMHEGLHDPNPRIRWRDHVELAEPVGLWLDRLLEPEPADRFASMAAARASLEAARTQPATPPALPDALDPDELAPLGIPIAQHVRYVGFGFAGAALYVVGSMAWSTVSLGGLVLEQLFGHGGMFFGRILAIVLGGVALPGVFALTFAYVAHALLMRPGLRVDHILGVQQPIRSLAQVAAVLALFMLPSILGFLVGAYALLVLTRPSVEPLLGPGLSVPIGARSSGPERGPRP